MQQQQQTRVEKKFASQSSSSQEVLEESLHSEWPSISAINITRELTHTLSSLPHHLQEQNNDDNNNNNNNSSSSSNNNNNNNKIPNLPDIAITKNSFELVQQLSHLIRDPPSQSSLILPSLDNFEHEFFKYISSFTHLALSRTSSALPYQIPYPLLINTLLVLKLTTPQLAEWIFSCRQKLEIKSKQQINQLQQHWITHTTNTIDHSMLILIESFIQLQLIHIQRLILPSLHQGEQGWLRKRDFPFEIEGPSDAILSWNLFIKGMANDLFGVLPRAMAVHIMVVVLHRSAVEFLSHYLFIRPSRARVGQYKMDVLVLTALIRSLVLFLSKHQSPNVKSSSRLPLNHHSSDKMTASTTSATPSTTTTTGASTSHSFIFVPFSSPNSNTHLPVQPHEPIPKPRITTNRTNNNDHNHQSDDQASMYTPETHHSPSGNIPTYHLHIAPPPPPPSSSSSSAPPLSTPSSQPEDPSLSQAQPNQSSISTQQCHAEPTIDQSKVVSKSESPIKMVSDSFYQMLQAINCICQQLLLLGAVACLSSKELMDILQSIGWPNCPNLAGDFRIDDKEMYLPQELWQPTPFILTRPFNPMLEFMIDKELWEYGLKMSSAIWKTIFELLHPCVGSKQQLILFLKKNTDFNVNDWPQLSEQQQADAALLDQTLRVQPTEKFS